MANLTIEVPDELARGLEGIAAAQRKTVQQLALEQLTAVIAIAPELRAGSPGAILRVMREQPHPTSEAQRPRARGAIQDRNSRSGRAGRGPFCASSSEDVDALDGAMASGRLPIHSRDLF